MDMRLMGERIKIARMEKRLTLEALSEKIGISRNFLWEIEAGRKAPAIQTLYKISKNLNISVDYLFGLKEQPILYKTNKDLYDRAYELFLQLKEQDAEIVYKLLMTYLNIQM